MRQPLITLVAALLLPVAAPCAVSFGNKVLAKTVDTSGACRVPTPSSTFSNTDAKVWLWFDLTGANAGDTPSVTWVTPAGNTYSRSNWDPLSAGGSWCLWTSMDLAGTAAAGNPGTWSVRVAWNGSQAFSSSFTVTGGTPTISAGGVLNGASYAVGAPVAPGSIVAVYGAFPLTGTSVAPGAPWPTTLGGLTMQFGGGTKAPLYFASGSQTNLFVPWELPAQGQSPLTATVNGVTSAPESVRLATYSPGIFSMNGQGTGQGAVLDTSYQLVDTNHPATAGSTYIQIYCTGLGPVTNRPASGGISPSGPLAMTTTTPVVTVGGIAAQVIFSGLAPGFVGEYQVNALVPAGVAPGNSVPVVLSIGGATSNTVTIAVRAGTAAAAQLTSVSPSSVTAGRTASVFLTAANTGFLQGETLANFGSGIGVGGAPAGQAGPVTVLSPTTAMASLAVDTAAATGTRAVTVTTGSQSATSNGIFAVSAPPQAMGPLLISGTAPANRASGVAWNQTVQVQFNEALDAATIGATTFKLAAGQIALPAAVAYDGKNTVTIAAAGPLSPQRTYTVTVSGQVRSAAGAPLGSAATFSFTTAAAPNTNGTVLPPSGVAASALTVIGFGGQTATPTASGAYTIAVNPTGVGLVAAMVPGKDFGLLSTTLPATTPNALAEAPAAPAILREAVRATGARRVYRTRWQVTASPRAAAGVGLTSDYQTSAESIVFHTPELFTRNAPAAKTVMAEVAASPATARLAAVLEQSAGAADPLNEPAVAPAIADAIQAVVTSLAQNGKAQYAAEEAAAGNAVEAGIASRPATVGVTPNCASGSTPAGAGLPCLDLRYLSFDTSDAVKVSQSPAGYELTPQNCTRMTLGCAVGWLGRLKTTTADPAAVQAEGGTESPVGPSTPSSYDDAACNDTNRCQATWISSESWLAYLDLGTLVMKGLEKSLSSMGVPIDGPAFTLPENTGKAPANYIVRFYSGGTADMNEIRYIRSGAYSDGARLHAEAWTMNVVETVFNMISAVSGLDGPGDMLTCALQSADKTLIQGGITGLENPTVGSFLESSRTFATGLLTDVGGCAVPTDKKAALPLVRMFAKGLKKAAGIAEKLSIVLEAASILANLGQAAQRSIEMTNRASAVETAMVVIRPGAVAAGNPLPSIAGLSPSSTPYGTSSLAVTITGLNFIPGSIVAVNNSKRSSTLTAAGQLQFTLESSDMSSAVPLEISVTNPPPGGGTARRTFLVTGAVLQAPAPTITSLLPSAAPAGSTQAQLTVQGSGFQSGATVKFNGVVHQTIPTTDGGQATILLSASDLARAAKVPVVAVNPGVNNESTPLTFTIYDSNPTLPAVDEVWTSQRTYLAGSNFGLTYRSVAGSAGGRYDLMVSVTAVATNNVYYYYDDPNDSNSRWLHSSVKPAWTGIPQNGLSIIPTGTSVFEVEDRTPSGKYHVKVYYSKPGANEVVNVAAETDFAVQTSTPEGGCFIASAAFGSPLAKQVQWLRAFRDGILNTTRAGRSMVAWYYSWSPRAAAWVKQHSAIRKVLRAALWPAVAFAWIAVREGAPAAFLALLVTAGLLAASLIRGPKWVKIALLAGLVLAVLAV